MFKNKRIVYIHDVEEMNKHLDFCKRYRLEAPSEAWVKLQRLPRAYYTLEIMYARIILRYSGNGLPYTEYIFYMDGSEHQQTISGMRAFNVLQRMSHRGVVDLTNNYEYYNQNYGIWNLGTIAGLIYFNPKYSGGRYENCVCYDRRSAYSAAMLEPIPNTNVLPKKNTYVGKGEIGFRLMRKGINDEEYFYALFNEGELAQYVYPAIESPFKSFVDYFYKKRAKAKGVEADRLKQMLNYAVGYIRRKNPFIHSCILSRARYYIESLIDENTLYSNTDSIISRVPRPDLDALVGNEVGQFKIEHKGSFAFNESGYQWNKEVPSIRGRSKEWFKNAYPNGFDILNDEIPFMEWNRYEYDKEKGKIIECDLKQNTQESFIDQTLHTLEPSMSTTEKK